MAFRSSQVTKRTLTPSRLRGLAATKQHGSLFTTATAVDVPECRHDTSYITVQASVANDDQFSRFSSECGSDRLVLSLPPVVVMFVKAMVSPRLTRP